MDDGRPWWATAFAGHYRAVYAHRDDGAAQEEIAALLPRLRTVPGPVLDVGCGHGRHLAAMRAAGIPAHGLDFSAELLDGARGRASCRGRLLRADMRRPPVGGGWGAVLMLFTSFGYFDDDENRACLAAWGRVLAPGGLLIVDGPEPDHLARTLVPASERQGEDGVLISEERRLCRGRVEKRVHLHRGGATILRYTEDVRLYDRAAFAALAREAGLSIATCWPGLRGPDQDDHRLVWFMGRSC